jgi:hypothetical protein
MELLHNSKQELHNSHMLKYEGSLLRGVIVNFNFCRLLIHELPTVNIKIESEAVLFINPSYMSRDSSAHELREAKLGGRQIICFNHFLSL